MKLEPVTIRIANDKDLYALCHTSADIFDNPVDPDLAREFLNDPRHHLAIAIVAGEIVGMATAVHYIHPDKKPELFINEAGVDKSVRGNGIGRRLIHRLCVFGKSLGCTSAWVATEPDNIGANKAYTAAGGRPSNKPFVMYEFDL